VAFELAEDEDAVTGLAAKEVKRAGPPAFPITMECLHRQEA
jgi:hypothetical protein